MPHTTVIVEQTFKVPATAVWKALTNKDEMKKFIESKDLKINDLEKIHEQWLLEKEKLEKETLEKGLEENCETDDKVDKNQDQISVLSQLSQLKQLSEINKDDSDSIVSKKKNSQITRDNISIYMLCQIPGISNATAKRIIDKYGHISDLIISLKSTPIDVDVNGKKFNKNIIKNLNDYLI